MLANPPTGWVNDMRISGSGVASAWFVVVFSRATASVAEGFSPPVVEGHSSNNPALWRLDMDFSQADTDEMVRLSTAGPVSRAWTPELLQTEEDFSSS